MVERPFRAVVFDLFGTIVRWDPRRLPTIVVRGREIPSTFPFLEPELGAAFGADFEPGSFLEAYQDVLREIERERLASGIEITCHERFARTIARLGGASNGSDALAGRLTRRHMAAVRSVTAAPAEWTDAVRRVARHHRLALLSNFDDSDTGREIVADTGLGDLFDPLVISADLRLRKPNPAIFRHVLDALGVEPEEALFVGDTLLEDVLGAQSVGMPVVWLSEGKDEVPEGSTPPDFVIPNVASLPTLLGIP